MTDKREQLAAMIDPEAFEGLNEDDASVFNWLTNDRRQAAYDILDRMLALIAEPDDVMIKAGANAIRNYYYAVQGHEPVEDGAIETDYVEAQVSYQAMIGVLQREER